MGVGHDPLAYARPSLHCATRRAGLDNAQLELAADWSRDAKGGGAARRSAGARRRRIIQNLRRAKSHSAGRMAPPPTSRCTNLAISCSTDELPFGPVELEVRGRPKDRCKLNGVPRSSTTFWEASSFARLPQTHLTVPRAKAAIALFPEGHAAHTRCSYRPRRCLAPKQHRPIPFQTLWWLLEPLLV